MAKLHGAWIWYEVMTTDAPAARAFYESVVGWTIKEGTQPPIFYGHIARADGAEVGGMLPLTAEMQAMGARPCWAGYIAVDDLSATIADILTRGGRQLAPRFDIPEGSFAMMMDPWGAAFYLMQPVPMEGNGSSRAFSPTEAQSVGWNELYAGDFEAALTFYTQVFGWDLSGSMDMGDFGTYQFLSHDGVPIGAMMPKPPHVPMACWNHYIRVSDFDAAHQAVLAGGGTVLHGPQEVPGGEWIINALDPQGAAFAIVGQKA